MPRFIKVSDLPTLTLTNPQTGSEESLGIRQFIQFIADTDATFNRNHSSARAALRIHEALEELGESDEYLGIEESDWEKLREASRAPSQGYPFNPSRKLLPFIDAIGAAQKKRPKPDAEAPPVSAGAAEEDDD